MFVKHVIHDNYLYIHIPSNEFNQAGHRAQENLPYINEYMTSRFRYFFKL